MADLLRLDGLVKRFGGLAATDGVSLTVTGDEIHALIGPNGAGKTTLIHQIAGTLRPDQGRILFADCEVTGMPVHARVAAGLARSYQLVSVFRRLSVLDNFAFPVQARSGSSFRFWAPARAATALFDEARAMAEAVDLGHRLDAAAGTLAHGEQRRLEIGLALATRPRLLLLDEPLAGLGPEESERMVALIAGLRGRHALLLVEHDMDAVFRLADRISVLVNGRVIATGAPDAIRANAEVQRAYLGDDAAVGQL